MIRALSDSLHQRAMEECDAADAHARRDDIPAAAEALRRALRLEKQAAEVCPNPWWQAILYRSAAWIAMNISQFDEAIRFATIGLGIGAADERTKEELREVLGEARRQITEDAGGTQ